MKFFFNILSICAISSSFGAIKAVGNELDEVICNAMKGMQAQEALVGAQVCEQASQKARSRAHWLRLARAWVGLVRHAGGGFHSKTKC